MTHIDGFNGTMSRNADVVINTWKGKDVMTAAFVTPDDTKAIGDGFEVVDSPIARVVAHPREKFFVRAHCA